jgi:predicted ATPase/class 3 adenylate cyclase
VTVPTITLTYLFTDVEGSTSQWEAADDMSERVERHFEILRDSVVGAGGEVFATMGDGIGAAFASARAAVGAAIAAQRALPASGLRVRMGLHTGEAQRIGNDYRGRALNRAARIMSTGHGQQILLSDMTAALVRGGPDPVDLVDLGVHALRDLAEPEHLWQVADPDLPSAFPPPRGRPGRCSAPRHRTSFVGREREVGATVDRIRDHPIVTVTGAGGAGKTRLALRAAYEAVCDTDDVWFVDLAPVTDAERVVDAVARAAGFDGPAASERDLAAAIGDRHGLVLLDNCEHVLDTVARITDRLAAACPNLRVLATSREPLGVTGEFVVPLHGLEIGSDAVELFEQRAAAAGATLDRAHRPTVERVCERLGGLPLAIELAAARVPMFGLHAVEALLDRPFDVLVRRSRTGDERHRTMHAAIDWSYRLLDGHERRLLEWLAVFTGGFELDAALDVASGLGSRGVAAADLLDSLARKSMIELDDGVPHSRYRLLEPIRAFALDQLATRGELAAALAAHADWMTTITGGPSNEPISAAIEHGAVRLEREADNWVGAIRTATALLSTDLLERLCSPATSHFLVSRHDLTGVLERAAAICPDGPARRAVAAALASSSAGSADTTKLHEWTAELFRLEGPEPSAAAHLVGWMSHVWSQRTEEGVRWCLAGARNPAFSQDARDLFHGIAIIERFSLTNSVDDLDWLVAGALDVIDRSEVVANRVVCRLGVAWALADGEPGYAMQLVQDAIEEIDALPHFMRSTLPGNVSRFMARVDPGLAAAYLLDRIGGHDCPSGYLDTIPVAYATALLDRVGHPVAEVALATLAASPYGTYLARLDLDRRARAALLEWTPLPWCDLIARVLAALADLALPTIGARPARVPDRTAPHHPARHTDMTPETTRC